MTKLQIKAQANNKAEVLIYGEIGWWENNAADFARQLKELQADELVIRINSGGGSLIDGIAMHNAIRGFNGKKIVKVDALAASAASIIAMAGDEVIMPKNTMLMIHNTSTYTSGGAEELVTMANVLAELDKVMANIYTSKTKQSYEVIKEMMDSETWITADKALELGFATSVVEDVALAASVENGTYSVNGVHFAKVPERVKSVATTVVAAGNNQSNKNKELGSMDIEALKKEHPEVYKQLHAQAFEEGKQSGVEVERQRIKAIEDVAIIGHDKLVVNAKFESGITAEALAMQILAAEKQSKQQFLANRQDDANVLNQINAQNVSDISASQPTNDIPDEFMSAFKAEVNKGVKNA